MVDRLLFVLACLLAAGAQAATDATLVARGRYLAIAGDCAACHTAAGRAPFSGGLAIASPLGPIYASNITPSGKAGIGGWTEAQFARALRAGVRADGSHLYPAMPYTAYAKLSDADTAALYAYFRQGVAAVDTPAPATRLPFPFNVRASMSVWNWLFLDTAPYQANPAKSAEWNRGAYLAQGLAHCTTCHTPRNVVMAEKPSLALRGASLGGWYAPDITPGKEGWDRQALVDYLTTGHASLGTGGTATAGGPMREAIDKSFAQMAPQDVRAIATYVLDLPAGGHGAPLRTAPAVPASDVLEMAGRASAGEQLYRNNCASCHQVDGAGVRGLPALRQHAVLRQPNADNLGMAILEGVRPEHGQDMPGFADALSDGEIAAIAGYVETAFGQGAATTDAHRVRALRHGGAASPLLWIARGGMAAGVLLVLAVPARRWRRRQRTRAV
jgi:mono/diheme cytochrome c family protein